MALPKYLSETITIGRRTYLIEVRKYQRGGKYMIIKQTGVRDDEQQPVIVYEQHMARFARIVDRAAQAVLTTVPTVEDAATRKRKRKEKANPPEFSNAGKRWTKADDQRLTEHFERGTNMDTLMKLFKRRTRGIEVRLYKLGLLSPRD